MASGEFVDSVVRKFLDDKLDLIKREYSPSHLIVFGSRAKGEAGAGSDIDILIVSERFAHINWPDRMGHFLNTIWPDVPVDAICYTPEEFEQMLHKQAPFVRNAVAEGIRIE